MAPTRGGSNPEDDNDSDERGGSPGGDGDKSGEVREQDRFLPIANVGRVMKRALPTNAKIAKDAKETMQECVSEFISFITGEASDKCAREKRKTINGDDILWAMSTLGFDDYIEPLKMYLHKYRESETEKVTQSKGADAERNGLQHGGGSSSSATSMQGGGMAAGTPGGMQQGMQQGMPGGMHGYDGMAPHMYMHHQ